MWIWILYLSVFSQKGFFTHGDPYNYGFMRMDSLSTVLFMGSVQLDHDVKLKY